MQYEIRVEGHLTERWAAWFDGLTITSADDGTTVIRGSVVDQAALHGLLQRLCDIGIPLISLTPVEDTDMNIDTNTANVRHARSDERN